MSEQRVIVDHHLDKDQGVYRIIIGVPREVRRPKTDGDGNPVHRTIVLKDELDEPVKDVNGNEIHMVGPPELELVTEVQDLQDYVFAADDKRWKGKSAAQIADAQRQEVKKALDARDREQAQRAAGSKGMTALPGVGEAL